MNKNSRNRLMSGLLALTLVGTMALPAGAALVKKTMEVDSGIRLYVGDSGSLVPTDASGNAVDVFSADGTTYLPARAAAEATGSTIAWNGKTATVYIGENTADEKDAAYLEYYFGIKPLSGTVSRADFDDALVKLGGEKTTGTGDLTTAQAVKAAVGVAGMNELALIYIDRADPDQIPGADRLPGYGVTDVGAEESPYVATALDCGLAFAGWNFGANLDAATANTLLMNAVEISGQGRNYLGMASDGDIYAEIQSAWSSFRLIENTKLSQLGTDLVLAGASTGYNVKYDGYNANFLPEYTLTYGHNEFPHAIQLIALLNSQGLDAKVAMEPKTSIYEYLPEWGDPAKQEATPTYAVKPIDGGRWLAYASEYDMKLEFNTLAEKDAFDAIVAEYAKKWDSNTDADGKPTAALLSGAWWQPLYYSTGVPMKDTAAYILIKDNVIRDGAYTIHPFSTVDGTAAIAKVVGEKAADLKVETTDLYVNKAFYNYLSGADHQ